MPTESSRLLRRLSARDRWFVGAVAVAVVVVTVAAALLTHQRPTSGAGGPCVTTVRASFTGGATFRYCGPSAVAFCRRPAARDEQVVAACERAGLARP